MPLYEHIFLARHDLSSQQVETMGDQFKKVIDDNEGRVSKIENWGLKSLAYKIKKSRKAHFTLMNIDAPHAAVAEMERQMTLSTEVVRFMTIKVEDLEDEPSVMLRKPEKDDKKPGGRPPRR